LGVLGNAMGCITWLDYIQILYHRMQHDEQYKMDTHRKALQKSHINELSRDDLGAEDIGSAGIGLGCRKGPAISHQRINGDQDIYIRLTVHLHVSSSSHAMHREIDSFNVQSP
jgi:hypothetical protein